MKRKTTFKKVMALLLTVLMVAGTLPVTVLNAGAEEATIKIAKVYQNNNTGTILPISDCYYIYNSDGFLQSVKNPSIYIGNSNGNGFPGQTTTSNAVGTISAASGGGFNLKTSSNRQLPFNKSGKYFDGAGGAINDGSWTSVYNLYRPAAADETSSSEIPGFVKMTSAPTKGDGKSYLVTVTAGDGSICMFYPATSTSDKNEHVATLMLVDKEAGKISVASYTTLSSDLSRGGTNLVTVCSDGATGNTSLGSIRFNPADIPDSVANITLSVTAHSAENKNNSAKLNIYLADKNITMPTATPTANGIFNAVFGNSILANNTANANNARNYFSQNWQTNTEIATINISDLSQTDKTFEFDVTNAVKAAKDRGDSVLNFIFLHPQSYSGSATNGWSDVYITPLKVSLLATEKVEHSRDEITTVKPSASDVSRGPRTATANRAADGSYTASGLTGGDEMSGVLWSYGVGPNSGYSFITGDNGWWQAGIQYGQVTLLYDGVNKMCFPINFFASRLSKTLNDGYKESPHSAYCSTTNLVELKHIWHGASSTAGYQSSTSYGVNIVDGHVVSSPRYRSLSTKNQTDYYSNTMYFKTDAFSTSSFSGNLTAMNTGWKVYVADDEKSDSSGYWGAFTTNSDTQRIRIINYKNIREAIITAEGIYNTVSQNENAYCPTGLYNFYKAYNELLKFDPNSYFNTSSTSGNNYQACADAITALEKYIPDATTMPEESEWADFTPNTIYAHLGLYGHDCTCQKCGETTTLSCTPDYSTADVSKAATCTEDGAATYDCLYCSQKMATVLKKTGHSYDEPQWTWADDFSSASAKFTCINSGCDYTESHNADSITPEIKDAEGVIVYTAEVTVGGVKYTSVVENDTNTDPLDSLAFQIKRYENIVKTEGSLFKNTTAMYNAYNNAKRYYDAVTYGGVSADNAVTYCNALKNALNSRSVNTTYKDWLTNDNIKVSCQSGAATVADAYKHNTIYMPSDFRYGNAKDNSTLGKGLTVGPQQKTENFAGNTQINSEIVYKWSFTNFVVGIVDGEDSKVPVQSYFFKYGGSDSYVRYIMNRNSDAFSLAQWKTDSTGYKTDNANISSAGSWKYIGNDLPAVETNYAATFPDSTYYMVNQASSYLTTNNKDYQKAKDLNSTTTTYAMIDTEFWYGSINGGTMPYISYTANEADRGYGYLVYMTKYKDNYQNAKDVMPALSLENYDGLSYSDATAAAGALDNAAAINLSIDKFSPVGEISTEVGIFADNVNSGATYLETALSTTTNGSKVTAKYIDLKAAIVDYRETYLSGRHCYSTDTWGAFEDAYDAAVAHFASLDPSGTSKMQYSDSDDDIQDLIDAIVDGEKNLAYTTDLNDSGHAYNEGTEDPVHNCGQTGTLTQVCSFCNKTRTTTIPAAGEHSPKQIIDDQYIASAATCTDEAVYYYVCETCGTVLNSTYEYGTASGHQWGEWVSNGNATCDKDGTKTKECSVCHTKETQTDVDSHLSVPHNVVTYIYNNDATCTENGTKTGYCIECGAEVTIGAENTAGHKMTKTDAKAATCLATGNNEYYTCSSCNKVYKDIAGATETTVEDETLAKLDHSYTGDYKYNAETKKHSQKCVNGCDEYGEETGCSFNDGVVTTEPTCTEKGIKTYTCSVCKGTYTEDVDAKGHSMTKTDAKAATCLAAGNNEYYTCSTCKNVYKDIDGNEKTTVSAETLAKLDHSYTGDYKYSKAAKKHSRKCVNGCGQFGPAVDCTFTGEVTKEPKCTEEGEMTYTCSACGGTYTEVLIASHGYVKHEEIPPTCHSEGRELYYTCKYCELIFNKDKEVVTEVASIPICGHAYVLQAEKPAACTEDGHYAYYTCEMCDTLFDTDKNIIDEIPVIEAAGHHVYTSHDAVTPTCTTDGNKKYYTCELCSSVFDVNKNLIEEVPVVGARHTYVLHEAAEATCSKAGNEKYYSCQYCDKVFNADKEPIEKAPIITVEHQYVEHPYQAVSCTQDGNEFYYTCNVCNKVFDKDKNVISSAPITKGGHVITDVVSDGASSDGSYSWVTRKCSRCTQNFTVLTLNVRSESGSPAKAAKVSIKNSSGSVVASGTTDANGKYVSPALPDGAYTVEVLSDNTSEKNEGSGTIAVASGIASGSYTKDGCLWRASNCKDCICHHNNFLSDLTRFFYTLLSKMFNKDIKCCDDMEWYF